MRSNNFDINFPYSLHTEVEALAKKLLLMFKTSMFPISDFVFQFASFGFLNMKLAVQNKQIGIPN